MKKDEIVFILVVFSMMDTMLFLLMLAAFMADVPFLNKLFVYTVASIMGLVVSMGIVEFIKRYKNLSKKENK